MKNPSSLSFFFIILISELFLFPQKSNPNIKEKEIKIVKIKDQVWMASNLCVDRFSNGDPIPEAKTESEWNQARINKKPAWCYPLNNPSNYPLSKLYNWYAVNDPRGLSPKGWHIPRKWEWEKLFDQVGGDSVAGYKLSKKLPSIAFYTIDPKKYEGLINSTGFQAESIGERNFIGGFNNNGEEILFWTKNDDYDRDHFPEVTKAICVLINSRYGYATFLSHYQGSGYAVRCIKD